MALTVRYKIPLVPAYTGYQELPCSESEIYPAVIPDTVVMTKDILDNSFDARAANSIDSPTSVTMNYRPSSGTSAPWVSQPARQALVGVDTGEVEDITSNIALPGTRRLSEAVRKAQSRLVRMGLPGRYSWQTFSKGVKYTKGSVVRLPDIYGLKKQNVRILNIRLVEEGLYQIDAEHYEESMYADQVTPIGDSTDVPVGLILPYEGDLPAGWANYSDANGLYIIGAGGDLAVGPVAGDTVVPDRSISTEYVPDHDVGFGLPAGGELFESAYDEENFVGNVYYARLSDYEINVEDMGNRPDGGHSHGINLNGLDPNLFSRHTKLMKKAGATSTTLPSEALMFGREDIYYQGIQRVIEHNSRYIFADIATADAGIFSMGISGTTRDGGRHTHNDGEYGFYVGGGTVVNLDDDDDSEHNHSYTGTVQRNLRRRHLPVYSSTNEFVIRPGMIGMWDGDINSLPTDFYLCDGENGTLDMMDYFVVYGGEEIPEPQGDNTIKIVGSTDTKGHHHKGSTISSGPRTTNDSFHYHADVVYHNHQIDFSFPWKPPAYALAFIQYLPE